MNKKQVREEFDKYKELSHIGKWIAIVIGVSTGVTWAFGLSKEFIPFVAIITVLMIIIILQRKELDSLKSKK